MSDTSVDYISPRDYPKQAVPLEPLSVEFMRSAKFVPLSLTDTTLTIAAVNPNDPALLEALRFAYNLSVNAVFGRSEDIEGTVERLYGGGAQSMETIIREADRDVYDISGEAEENADHLRDLASEAPIIRLVNRLILNAVIQNASDIHFEPFENEFVVRYRIDGVLTEVESPPKRLQAAVISRVKIMAKLDIAERRLPQDGRIKLKIEEREIDFRVSTIPTLYGESLVMRVLDRETMVFDLTRLGFPEDRIAQYRSTISQPYGMILVTGPTGSGKTSTLYTTLYVINTPEKKIITLEDPVEYQLKGVNQIQVNPRIGLTFANGLRSVVRQDPDVILVGEIRDAETARIAVQSALTGHLLFSTLHTNDAAGAVTRLLDMEVEHFLLATTLLEVLAQRLVRVICPDCKSAVRPSDREIRSLNLSAAETEAALSRRTLLYAGAGCPACRNTGFRGRTGLFEQLPVTDTIRQEINRRATAQQIRTVALSEKMIPLREDGWRKAKAGITTVSEILRVTLNP